MSTVLLFGDRSPAMTSLMGVARSLNCHVFECGVFECGGVEAPTRRMQTIRFDLIVTEFRPEEDRTERFLTRISSFGPLPLLVTGPELSGRQQALIESGREHATYLPINSSPASKLEAVRALLPEVPRTQLRVGPLHLDTADHVVCYGRLPLPLTSTEYKLLHSLMTRPGQTLDCGTLGRLSQCHDVPSHVNNLRRKFSGYAAGSLLRGNRQTGYAIDARHHQRTTRNAGFALRDHLLHLI